MTELCIRIYHFLTAHRTFYVILMVVLFAFFGFFASRIELEEDLSRLIPSSKNDDGTTKLAFADLRIKDKTFLLFSAQGAQDYGPDGSPLSDKPSETTGKATGAGATKRPDASEIAAVCDEFVDSLNALDRHRSIDNVFNCIPEETPGNALDYLSQQLPCFIDTSYYARIDTLLTPAHLARQMEQNQKDFDSDFGQAYPEAIQQDPLGLRSLVASPLAASQKGSKGGYRIVEGHFFVADSSVCVAFITPRFSAMDTGDGSRLFDELNELIPRFAKTHPNVGISYHGTPASGYYNAKVIKHDLVVTVLGSLCIVLLVISLCFHRVDTVPLLVLPVAFGTIFALAVMYFLKGRFSLMALGLGAVILGVALSYALHLYTHSRYVDNPEQLLRDQVKPVCLGCITTVGAFLGLLFVKTELLRDFGLFAIFAVLGTVAFCLTLLPPMLPLNRNHKPLHALQWVDRINSYPYHRNKGVMAVVLGVIVVCVVAWAIKGTRFDADLHSLGYVSEEVKHSEDLLRSKTFTGDKEKYFATSGRTPEEAISNFSHLAGQLDSLKKAGLVKSYTPTNLLLVSEKVQQQRIDAWKNYWTPERVQRAQSLIAATAPAAGLNAEGFEPFFETIDADYEPDPLYKADVLPKGYLSTLMEQSKDGHWLCFTSVRCANDSVRSDSSDYMRICDAVAKEPHQMVLDTYYYTTDGLKTLNNDFNTLQWVSMLFVLVVLLLSCKFRLGSTLAAFAPILVSWLVLLGVMALTGSSFNLVSIIISTFIFGMGVDYSIFVMSGLQGGDSRLLQCHKTAIFFSAVTLIVTVGSMIFATHPAIRGVGFATCVGLVSAVVLSYTIEPALYNLLCRRQKKGEQ